MSSCNLIVNYLPPDLDENELESLFGEYGKVVSLKIVKNKETGASMCYGFVVMQEPEQASASVVGLNSKSIRGKVLRVGLAKPKDMTENKDTSNTNLYITGINDATTETDLEAHFSKFGEIVSSRVVKSKASPNKAVAFVKFSCREDAEKAIEIMNGQILCIKDCPEDSCACADRIAIKFSLTPSKQQMIRQVPNVQPGNPYQMGVPFAYPLGPNYFRPQYNATYEVSTTLPNYGYATGHLQTFMPQATTVARLSSAVSQQMNQYANYYNSLSSYNIPQPYQNPVAPQSLVMAPTQQYSQIQPNTYPQAGVPTSSAGLTPGSLAQLATGSHCVFVYGLSQATTEEELLGLFLPFGAVSNCRVCYETNDGKRSCKGFGFINFYSYNDAQQAITSLNNFNYKGRALQVRFKSSKDIS